METSGQERCPARAWGIVRSASYPPAVRWLRPSSEDEMVALFLRTELTSVRHGPRIRELLDHEQLSERLLVAPDLTSPRENGVRRHRLSAHRGYEARIGLFNGF